MFIVHLCVFLMCVCVCVLGVLFPHKGISARVSLEFIKVL